MYVTRHMSHAYKLFLRPCERLGRIVLPLEAGCKGVLEISLRNQFCKRTHKH